MMQYLILEKYKETRRKFQILKTIREKKRKENRAIQLNINNFSLSHKF